MKKVKSKADKRHAQRISLPLGINYRLLKKKAWKEASCKDISGIGLGLSLEKPLKVEDRVEISIAPKNAPKAISALCKIAWCAEAEKGKFKVGLEVIKVKNPIRFIEFICNEIVNSSVNQ